MSIEQQILGKLRELPAQKQQEVLAFVDSLKEMNGAGSRFAACAGFGKT